MSVTKQIVHSHSVPELLIAETGQEAIAGVPLDVPAAIANRLLEQKHWHEYEEPKKPKPAAKKSAEKADKED